MRKKPFELSGDITGQFVYVDCGARDDISKPLLEMFAEARYIGFEPDKEESNRLNSESGKRESYFPVAAGKHSGIVPFYITSNPSCSSLLLPNQAVFDSFMECAPFFEVVDTQQIEIVTLDDYLPLHDINDIDFLELDTQGTELDILQGAEGFLSSSVVGVKVEVEFLPMYQSQPLFSEVDAYMRGFGFKLFDLQRYHLRRKSLPRDVQSKEQIIWGQALYLRDYQDFDLDTEVGVQKMSKLAVSASYYGFYSYALEIIDWLMAGGIGEPYDTNELSDVRSKYIALLSPNWLVRAMLILDRPPFSGLFRLVGSALLRLVEAFLFVTRRRVYVWKD